MASVWNEHGVREVVNFAAESHVDRSIISSGPFVQTNVCRHTDSSGSSKANQSDRYVQVSTDEVHGSLPKTNLM